MFWKFRNISAVVENVNPVIKQRMHKGWIFDIQYWLLAMKADKYSNISECSKIWIRIYARLESKQIPYFHTYVYTLYIIQCILHTCILHTCTLAFKILIRQSASYDHSFIIHTSPPPYKSFHLVIWNPNLTVDVGPATFKKSCTRAGDSRSVWLFQDKCIKGSLRVQSINQYIFLKTIEKS